MVNRKQSVGLRIKIKSILIFAVNVSKNGIRSVFEMPSLFIYNQFWAQKPLYR